MAGLMDMAEEYLRGVRRSVLATEAVYIPQDGPAVPVRVTRGATVFRAEDQYGMVIREGAWDFLVEASELGAEPRPGDAIECGDARYEVRAPNGEPCWRWSGRDRRTYRIHTKEAAR